MKTKQDRTTERWEAEEDSVHAYIGVAERCIGLGLGLGLVVYIGL